MFGGKHSSLEVQSTKVQLLGAAWEGHSRCSVTAMESPCKQGHSPKLLIWGVSAGHVRFGRLTQCQLQHMVSLCGCMYCSGEFMRIHVSGMKTAVFTSSIEGVSQTFPSSQHMSTDACTARFFNAIGVPLHSGVLVSFLLTIVQQVSE